MSHNQQVHREKKIQLGVQRKEGGSARSLAQTAVQEGTGDSQEAQERAGHLQEQHLRAVWGQNDEGTC